ncbi:MAG: HAD family phosphatase [Clostridia bacterium]|nr:HAD family phosphatase [Clostridia bacterium]
MKKKILASDFDGTLCQRYTEDGYPATAEVLEAIRQFRKNGGLFGVVTGRDWRWSWYELDRNGKLEFDFIMALNGAQIYDRAGNLLSEVTADGNADFGGVTMARALAQRCWELAGDTFIIAKDKERYYFSPGLPDGGQMDDETYFPHDLLDSIGCFHMAGAVSDTAERSLAAGEILKKEFGACVNPQPNGRSLDIPPAGIGKGIAVARYAEIMGVPADDVWTAGDNYNDIDMLRAFHGCAMANGVQAAKDAAKYVCRDLAETVERIRNHTVTGR